MTMQNDPHVDNTSIAAQQLRSAQTLLTVAFISAPVSLVVGGVLLDIVAIVCACIARSKIKAAKALGGPADLCERLGKQSRIALWIGIGTGVVNLIFAIYMATILFNMIASGDINEYLNALSNGSLGSGTSTGGDKGGSIWD